MKTLKLAVISDIHAGEGARSSDLCPRNQQKDKVRPDERYRDKFLDFLKEKNLSADFLLLPGDITHSAQPEEVQIASEFVTSAADRLNVAHENIVFVPGNHDVDWSVLKTADTTGLRRTQRYDPIAYQGFQFSSILKRAKGNLLSNPNFAIWNYSDLLVVGYNSSHHDEPSKV